MSELQELNQELDWAIDSIKRKQSEKRLVELVSSIGSDFAESLKPFLEKVAENARITKEELEDAIRKIQIAVPEIIIPPITVPEIKSPAVNVPPIVIPEIKIPSVKVSIPEIKAPVVRIPPIKVPKSEVIVNVPEIKLPKIEVPQTNVEFPERMDVRLWEVNQKNPLPVILTDIAGHPYMASGGGGGGARIVSARRSSANLNIVSIDIAANGDNTVIAGVAGQSIKIYKIFFVCNSATNIILKNGTTINMTGTMNFNANGSLTLDYDEEPWFRLANGNSFVINLSAANQVSGSVQYIQNNE